MTDWNRYFVARIKSRLIPEGFDAARPEPVPDKSP
jgi:hypothetical protein